ncbi:hypothetical protein ABZ746_37580 [Streptomyces sp. NPDC020096]
MTTETQAGMRERIAELETERDQYASASRHLSQRIREVACTWSRTLPETVRTADVVTVLLGIASHVPDRPELRDDLWQRIAGAYEARLENDGHPEDAQAAADEAMSVVQPEMDKLRAERDRLRSDLDLMRVQAKSLSDQLNGQGLRLSNSGLRELGEARTEVRRLCIEMAESKAERDHLAAEVEALRTEVAKRQEYPEKLRGGRAQLRRREEAAAVAGRGTRDGEGAQRGDRCRRGEAGPGAGAAPAVEARR